VVPGETKSEFTYDSQGRKRISTEYTWDAAANEGAGDWVQSDQTKYIYDGMDLVQECAADGTVKASYVRDGNIGGILSMTNADGTFAYHYDGNGNVVALTDASDDVVAQYSYDAYGNLLTSSGSEADKNPFRFSSKYYDGDTGLYDYGYRFYDASLGRWINRDPITESGGLNLYTMVNNNPISSTDNYGLHPKPGDAEYDPYYDPFSGGPPPTSGAYYHGSPPPDYSAFNFGVGEGIGLQGQAVEDKFGQWYFGIGPSFGFGPPVSGSYTQGYILDVPNSTRKDLATFMQGSSFNVSGGALYGAGITGSKNLNLSYSGTAVEQGIFSPQISGNYTFDFGPFGGKSNCPKKAKAKRSSKRHH
jgi:RHS repeat-associated protein